MPIDNHILLILLVDFFSLWYYHLVGYLKFSIFVSIDYKNTTRCAQPQDSSYINSLTLKFIMQLLTYEEIREKALLQGISDNKVSIGMWASLKGYIKTRKQIKKKVYTMYYAPQTQPNQDLYEVSDSRFSSVRFSRII